MERLQSDWLTQGWIDFEYKKYVVLAYLKGVRHRFADKMLFPDLPDVQALYESGVHFRQRKGTLSEHFPKEVSGVDPEKLRFRYSPKLEDDDYMQQVDAIMDFALPRFRQIRDEGQQMAADIAADLTLAPVGVMPLRKEEGYLFLHWTALPETHIYAYSLTLYTTAGRQIRTRYLDSVRKGVGTTFEGLKRELIRKQPDLPNPATYLVEAKRYVPLEETFLPMAQRLVGKAVGVA